VGAGGKDMEWFMPPWWRASHALSFEQGQKLNWKRVERKYALHGR
jgi:hypothetical protein